MEIKFKKPGGEQLRQLALPLAVGFGLLALWLAWSGASQWRDHQREEGLATARDSVALAIGSAVKTQTAQLGKSISTPAVQSALLPGAPAIAVPPPPDATAQAATPAAAPAPDFAAAAAALKAA